MCDSIRGLLAKVWKDEVVDLAPGTHSIDEVMMVRVNGTVRKECDTMCSPTASIPVVLALALFWERCGVTRDAAITALRHAISESLSMGTPSNEHIASKMRDVQTAVDAIKRDLLDLLPKQKRSGRLIVKDLDVQVLPVADEAMTPAA